MPEDRDDDDDQDQSRQRAGDDQAAVAGMHGASVGSAGGRSGQAAITSSAVSWALGPTRRPNGKVRCSAPMKSTTATTTPRRVSAPPPISVQRAPKVPPTQPTTGAPRGVPPWKIIR